MIYVDSYGHMIADDYEELHQFAQKIGLKRRWFQTGDYEELHQFAQKIGLKRRWFQTGGSYPHYDLTTNRMRQKAINAGAIEIPPRELLEFCQNLKRGHQ